MVLELELKIQDVVIYINDWNKQFGNFCQVVKVLMDVGLSQWIKEIVQKVKLSMMVFGVLFDYLEVSNIVDMDGDVVIVNVLVEVNSVGKMIIVFELNVLWVVFNVGNMGFDDFEKELMMVLVGIMILCKVGLGFDVML